MTIIDAIKRVRYGVIFTAQTQDGIEAAMKRYYALPTNKRRGTYCVTPGCIFRAKK